jgi:hypothetical protein
MFKLIKLVAEERTRLSRGLQLAMAASLYGAVRARRDFSSPGSLRDCIRKSVGGGSGFESRWLRDHHFITSFDSIRHFFNPIKHLMNKPQSTALFIHRSRTLGRLSYRTTLIKSEK